GLEGARRTALWDALGADNTQDALPMQHIEPEADLIPLDVVEEINWDYAFTEHSTLGHPLSPMRAALAAQGLPEASAIRHLRNGRRIRYAGMVICRQRPGTAKGVLFLTLEDETGL